ncbi:MAG: hypothetical protein R3318_04225 [Gammaproteobacteria bacterium]|nr:hypothetical protein [Gammaproteobacteria bacterium]
MQSETSKDGIPRLGTLIVLECIFLGFCIWLAFALQAEPEVPLWFQTAPKSVIALLLIITLPGRAALWFKWNLFKRTLARLMVVGGTAGMTGMVFMSVFQIESGQGIFMATAVSVMTGLMAARLLFNKTGLSQH